MKITCPYCFRTMKDDEVLFRSEKVNQGESGILPEEYSDKADFIARYRKDDKVRILNRLEDWEFFEEGPDFEYEKFWEKFNGTTEYNLADEIVNLVKAYYRKVVDPQNIEHQKYLKIQPDGSYFKRDKQGMVSSVELISGEECSSRVCKYCHNPLPANYGKSQVKFITVIGITGAGKTVYISQILNKMVTYAAKVGLSARKSAGAQNFVKNNEVSVNKALPGSTPIRRFQQPIVYEIGRDAGGENRFNNTLVLYDVAGEIFNEGNEQLVPNFAPFIEHADGVILLIDPMQFETVSNVNFGGQTLSIPATALNTINTIVSHGVVNKKCEIPFAVCISKVDTENVQNVLNPDLRGMLLNDVQAVLRDNGLSKSVFDAKSYNPIAKYLSEFIRTNDFSLAQILYNDYVEYNFFAFTALGCDVKESEDGGYYPVGPILPKRIEEPLLWLFNKFGYIGENEEIFDPLNRPTCPECKSKNCCRLPEDKQTIKTGFLGLKTIHVNTECLNCGNKWEDTSRNN